MAPRDRMLADVFAKHSELTEQEKLDLQTARFHGIALSETFGNSTPHSTEWILEQVGVNHYSVIRQNTDSVGFKQRVKALTQKLGLPAPERSGFN